MEIDILSHTLAEINCASHKSSSGRGVQLYSTQLYSSLFAWGNLCSVCGIILDNFALLF